MSGPQTLSRPLAARVAGLPDPGEWAAGPDLPTAVIDAACQALDAGKTHYTDRPGILPLRTWVAAHLNAWYDLNISPEAITITCGSTEARFVAVYKLVPAGTRLVCPGAPDRIAGTAALAGATLVSEVDDPAGVSAVYLTPDQPRSVIDPLLSQDWWIIWDTSGSGGAGFHPAQNPKLAGRIVTIGSFSDRMPGWRVGWMAGSDQAKQLRAYKQSLTICSTSISQWAALGLVGTS
jgi:aspartate/methionine/tyrosine aminotransferase